MMVGFRLKFDNISKFNISNFLISYVSKFDFFEIKLTNMLLREDKLRYILKLSKKYAAGKYSIHLPKNFLDEEFDYENRLEIIRILKEIKCIDKISLILHMPYCYDEAFILKLYNLAIELQEYYILLENEKILKSNMEYLKSIDSIIKYLVEEKKIENVGICFDIGHFQYGILKEGISSQKIYFSLFEFEYFSKYIKEYHLHDYNQEIDHLHLKDGIMSLDDVSKFIRKINTSLPIILEINIINPDLDGKQQIKIVETEILIKEM